MEPRPQVEALLVIFYYLSFGIFSARRQTREVASWLSLCSTAQRTKLPLFLKDIGSSWRNCWTAAALCA